MFNFLLSLCIFCISLTPQNGVLNLTDKEGTKQVKNEFTYECPNYKYEVYTSPYWLNSITRMDVLFYQNCLIWHYEVREGQHTEDWTIKVYHHESKTWIIESLKREDYLFIPLQDGDNTYDFVAVLGDEDGAFFKFEFDEIFTVWREKK